MGTVRAVSWALVSGVRAGALACSVRFGAGTGAGSCRAAAVRVSGGVTGAAAGAGVDGVVAGEDPTTASVSLTGWLADGTAAGVAGAVTAAG